MYSIYRVRRPEEFWHQSKGRVLLTWTILNPNGPTLSCIGMRLSSSPGQMEIYYRWMHFMGGETYVLGFIGTDAQDISEQLLDVLTFAFLQAPARAPIRFPFVTCVPSFVTPPDEAAAAVLSHEHALSLLSEAPAFARADWGREMYYVRKYGPDLFARAAEEVREQIEASLQDPDLDASQRQFLEAMKEARSSLPGLKDWRPGQYASRAIESGDVRAWWEMVTDREFYGIGLGQLANAWVGAIHQSGGAVQPVETFETVRSFLASQQSDFWPEDWSTSTIAARMGLA